MRTSDGIKIRCHNRLRPCLWIALLLQQRGYITFDVAEQYLGLSMRTYRRCIRDLREAGMILSEGSRTGSRGLKPGTFFVAFDETLAPVCSA